MIKKRINRKDIIQWSIVGLILLLITLLQMGYSPMAVWRDGDTGTDSSVFKYIAYAMSEGYMPYRDTFDHKGPLIYFINWIGMGISYWRGVWFIEVISLFFTFCMFYKIARLMCGRFMSMTIVVIIASSLSDYFEGGNLVEEYALPFLAVSLYFFLDYFLNSIINRKRLILCGLSFGAVCMLRPNMIALWVVFCIAVLVDCIKNHKFKELRNFILYFILGIAVIFVPVFIWLIANGAFKAFIDVYIKFNMMYSSDEGYKAIGITFLTFLNTSMMLFATVILFYQTIKKRTILDVACLLYLFFSLVLVSMSGRVYGHYGIILLPTLCYPFARIGHLVERRAQENEDPVHLFVIGYLLVVLALPVWINAVDYAIQRLDVVKGVQHSPLTTQVISIINDNTTDNDKISVYGNWDIIYVLSQRQSASMYSYQYPIGQVDNQILDKYFEELQVAHPKVVVIQAERMDSRMEEFLADYNYQLVWFDNAIDDGAKIYCSNE